jgi:hypothetical protein
MRINTVATRDYPIEIEGIQKADPSAAIERARVCSTKSESRLNDSTSLDDPDQNYDDRQDQQDVDESAQRVGGDETEQPKNQKYNGDCPKQVQLLSP